MGSPEFTAVIRTDGWSREGLHGGECAALVVEATALGLNPVFCCISGRCPTRVTGRL